MNKYEVTATLIVEAANQEAAEDIVRDILEAEPEIIDYSVGGVVDAP